MFFVWRTDTDYNHFVIFYKVLLATLNEVKQSSVSIDLSISESSQVRTKLMGEYNQYQLVCKEAARLFIGITSIYNLSVDAFTTLFLRSINSNEVCEIYVDKFTVNKIIHVCVPDSMQIYDLRRYRNHKKF